MIVKNVLQMFLNSQLEIEKAKLNALDKCYASYSEATYPLQQATKAAIKEIKRQTALVESYNSDPL